MNIGKHFFQTDQVRLLSCAALLVVVTGCQSHEHRPPPRTVYANPPGVETVYAMQDDYIYYPYYQVYYSGSRRQYAYREGNAWVARPAPYGVPVNVLRASPAVRMDFHDSPANHNAVVVQQYPKDWAPPGPNQGHKENKRDGQRGENDGK